jgi:hypothetical protein
LACGTARLAGWSQQLAATTVEYFQYRELAAYAIEQPLERGNESIRSISASGGSSAYRTRRHRA